MLEIEELAGDEAVPYIEWFNDVPARKRGDSESTASIIVNLLQKRYYGLLGLVDGEVVGMVVYYRQGPDSIGVKFMYGRTHLLEFYDTVLSYLKKYDIKTFDFESIHEPKLWNRMFPGRITKIRSTYRFDVAG